MRANKNATRCSASGNTFAAFAGISVAILAIQMFFPVASVYSVFIMLACSGDVEPNPGKSHVINVC